MTARGIVKLTRRVTKKVGGSTYEVWALTVPQSIVNQIDAAKRRHLYFAVEATDDGILFRFIDEAPDVEVASPAWMNGGAA